MVRVLEILRQILQTLIADQPQIETTDTGYSHQLDNPIDPVTANGQPIEIHLLDEPLPP